MSKTTPRSYSDAPLDATELQELRRIIETERRTRWLWATIRTFALWITAVIAAFYALGEVIVRALKGLLGVNQ